MAASRRTRRARCSQRAHPTSATSPGRGGAWEESGTRGPGRASATPPAALQGSPGGATPPLGELPPKIVGLDFAVDAAGDAWLLEVNRTPGLVGRAEVDRAVKDAVVDAAWGLREDVLEELLL